MLSLSGLSPAEGEKLVSPSTLVEMTIVDDGNGIEVSTIIVNINGARALTGTTFNSGQFDGTLSSITLDGSDYAIIIDPINVFDIGSIISVQVQAQNMLGQYFNYTYVFKIVPSEPILISSNPVDKGILFTQQLLEMEFEDIIDGVDLLSVNVDINGLDYIIGGVATVDPNGVLTEVVATTDGAIVRVDPVEALKDGPYIMGYSVSDNSGNTLIGEIRFDVDLPEATLPDNFSQLSFEGYFQGIKRVSDIGCGDALLVEWPAPIPKNYKNDSFVLIYENEYRLRVFDDDPKYLATSDILQANTNGLTPGMTLSYGARALEFPTDTFTTAGMSQMSTPGFFRLPSATTLTSTVDVTDLVISVDSIAGYPEAGYIMIGREAIRYTSISTITNSFLVPPNGRSAFSTEPAVYSEGDEVKLFLEYTDSNSAIIMSTPTYHDGYRSGRELDYEGFVVTDYDDDIHFFQGFDFCGWHDALPQEVLQGECGSYQGGEFNGFRGLDLYDRMLSREEVLLDQVGEPVILLKRIWTGETCTCMDLRKMSTKVKSCPECYGTGFIGGYEQYLNLRRSDRRMMASFDETPEDISSGEYTHLQQEYEPGAWTLPSPIVRDRDMLVRFDYQDNIEFIYEVLDVSREKLMFRKFGRQKMRLKRMDKTDIIYTFDYTLF